MAEFNHLVLVKFKDDVVLDDVLKGLEKLVSDMDTVKSFVWGKDIESPEILRQGFTHSFLMTFSSKEDFTAFASHPTHLEFSSTFSAVIEKAIILDFPAVTVKLNLFLLLQLQLQLPPPFLEFGLSGENDLAYDL